MMQHDCCRDNISTWLGNQPILESMNYEVARRNATTVRNYDTRRTRARNHRFVRNACNKDIITANAKRKFQSVCHADDYTSHSVEIVECSTLPTMNRTSKCFN